MYIQHAGIDKASAPTTGSLAYRLNIYNELPNEKGTYNTFSFVEGICKDGIE